MRASLAVLVAVVGCSSPPPTPVPTGSISGTVTVSSEMDVSSVVLALAGPTSSAALADAAGTYSFEHLADGVYAVTASAPSTSPSSVTVGVTVTGGAKAQAAPLALTALGKLAGKVTLSGAATGNGGTLVFLDGSGFSASTDDSGAWTMTGVPTGSYVARASHAGFQSGATAATQVRWNATASAPDLDLQPNLSFSGEIRGTVDLVGLGPSGGVDVSMTGGTQHVTSDDAGSFVVSGVSEGVLALDLVQGPYRGHMPSVLSLPGGSGFVVGDDGLTPLEPFELQRGQRLDVDAESSVVLSPDGQRAVFLSRQPGIYVCDLFSMAVSGPPMVPLARNVRCYAIFTPDSQSLFFADLVGNLFIIPVAGGTARSVGPYGSVTFAPGGRRAAVENSVNSELGVSTLAVYDLDAGTLTQITSQLYAYAQFQFSKDAQRVLFVDIAGGGTDVGALTVADVTSGAPQVVAMGIRSGDALFMPDQASVYLLSRDTVSGYGATLKVVPLDGGPGQIVDYNVDSSTYEIVVSASGQELAYRADAGPPYYDEGTVTVTPLDGGAHRTYGVAEDIIRVPGGTHFIFYVLQNPGYGTWAVPLAGGPAAQLFTSYFGDEFFTPDGERVVTRNGTTTGQELLSSLIDGGGALTLSSSMLDEPVFAPDAGSVLFREAAADGGTVVLRLVDISTGVGRTLGTDVSYVSNSSFSTDGTRVVWLDNHGGVFSAAEAGGPSVQLSSAAVGNYAYATLSPDGLRAQWLELDPRTQSYIVTFAPATGGPHVAALTHPWQYSSLGDPLAPRLFPQWFGPNGYLTARALSPSPYRFQDGWYLVPTQ
jgi:Tol biopolymer transport system component